MKKETLLALRADPAFNEDVDAVVGPLQELFPERSKLIAALKEMRADGEWATQILSLMEVE